MNFLATIAGIILAMCYIPQIIKTFKTKNVDGMSLSFWIMLCIALLLLTVNALMVFMTSGVWGLFVTELFNLILALVMLSMVFIYRKKKEK